MSSAVDYSGLFPGDLLNSQGLTLRDIEQSIQLAWLLSEAVKLRRTKIRQGSITIPSDEVQQQEQRDDDRVFLGVVTLLAARSKPKTR
jgi:hypothetical protein